MNILPHNWGTSRLEHQSVLWSLFLAGDLGEPARIGLDGDSFSVTRTTIPSAAPRGR